MVEPRWSDACHLMGRCTNHQLVNAELTRIWTLLGKPRIQRLVDELAPFSPSSVVDVIGDHA